MTPEIGAATGIEFLGDGQLLAAGAPWQWERDGGDPEPVSRRSRTAGLDEPNDGAIVEIWRVASRGHAISL
jgi:hypothetical protein